MNRLEMDLQPARTIVSGKKLDARVAQLLLASGRDFVSAPVDELPVTYEGIAGDFHAGLTRSSGGREPWYKRGTEMRNERQLSILSVEELAIIARNMKLERVDAGWIGANLVLEGIPDMSFLPPRTLLIFENGVTLRIDGYNAPCRIAGGEIARHTDRTTVISQNVNPGVDWTRTDTALSFTHAAEMKRGLVAWVEREGTIRQDEKVTVRIWPQWIY
jgi:hypothetical protein